MDDGPFETDEEENQWWQALPSVPAVTGILLRQQNRRRWKVRALVQMFSRFPQLREIHYEPWREWVRYEQRYYESLLESLGGARHPNLRKLVVFENFDQRYASSLESANPRIVSMGCDLVRRPSPAVTGKLARKTRDFLRDLEPAWSWPSLRSLVLTSRLLSAKPKRQAGIDALLESAAAAAMRMPKLETMEIWNGGEGLAGTFQYRSSPSSITWRGTWARPFPPSVSNSVVRPVSLQQIRLKDRVRKEEIEMLAKMKDHARRMGIPF
ncbi:Oxoglutarate iron-dependent oxygenase [Apiospora phragmitis]|uniref:Oxoglutarate iron-dependent oxygenase n=1 Tax=Apiospora phragmitis TaxID=2905665 RepID=A0ABR1UGK8_9PEZI